MKRKDGFYWARFLRSNEWAIVQSVRGNVYVAGHVPAYSDGVFAEIIPMPITRDASTPEEQKARWMEIIEAIAAIHSPAGLKGIMERFTILKNDLETHRQAGRQDGREDPAVH